MIISAGSRLGPYEILSRLGAGGMGEVYRARDTRLGRDVAVKILPERLSRHPDARARFEREARAVSSLNHPHICTLHDVGTEDGTDFLVMEHLEGETLLVRLERGPLPLKELLRLGIQIADALAAAHRQGVVHRDLKPGNVMITKAGAKLMDFGLAKGFAPGAASDMTSSPTVTSPLTAAGTIVGTFQYMAPEQLEGREADARSDLWAFGAVLYEMASGRRAFEGRTQASLIASILKEEPRPLPEIEATAPPALDRIIRRCLAKDPDARWQTALDLRSELEWIASGAPSTAEAQAVAARRGALPPWAARAAAAVLTAAAFGAGWLLHRPAPPGEAVTRTSIVLPQGTVLDTDNASIALSPDGRLLAYAGRGPEGPTRLWVRPLDSLTPQPLAGTDGASYPFWSPDGRQIGFFADGMLRKVQAAGGTVQAICKAEDGRGATWGADGVIVFAPRPLGPLHQVQASGGLSSPVTTVADEGVTQRNPRFLPDGRRLLFYSGRTGGSGNGIYSLDVASKATALVLAAESEGIYVEPGRLVFVRDGNLMAQRIDLATLRTSGGAAPIAENVQFNTFRFTGTYTFSGNGLMLYQSGAIMPPSQLTWFDLEGNRLRTVAEPAIFWLSVKISHDGRRAAATVRRPDGKSDLWMYDLSRGVGSRFTFGEPPGLAPVWSPDGRHVAFSGGDGAVYVKGADGASAHRLVFTDKSGTLIPWDWTPDGSRLIYTTQSGETGQDLWAIPMTGDPVPHVIVATEANELNASVSPDGRWLAYASDESGRFEIYMISFPGPGGKWQLSTGGGLGGDWLGDGRLFAYRTEGGKIFAVEITASGPDVEIGAPRPLLGGRSLDAEVGDFSPDGKRLLAAVPTAAGSAPALTLVTHWASALRGE